MKRQIQTVAVLGSGVMGAGIAAHLANAGIDAILLDRPGGDKKQDRNRLAQTAVNQLSKQKPSPIFSKSSLDRIRIGNFEDDLSLVAQADWIIEAVVEDLEAKRNLLSEVEQHWCSGVIVSSNTSGLSIEQMSEGRSDAFKRHFLGVHFFNPPRYMKLVEIIPTKETSQEVISTIAHFIEYTLGKGVVFAKDTPNFIANRIGVFSLLTTMEEMRKSGLTVSEVDQLTGTAIGRPKSATFRTLDLVGLDTFLRVVDNVTKHPSTDSVEKAAFRKPEIISDLVSKGHLGDKVGKGFYFKKKTEQGQQIYQIDVRSKQYAQASQSTFECLEQAARQKEITKKLKTIAYSEDEGGRFVWNTLKRTLLYAASKIPEIADDVIAVDQAMKWGFNWKLGPFEIWDAIGLRQSAEKMKAEGEELPLWIEEMLTAGQFRFYEQREGRPFYIQSDGEWSERQRPKEEICLAELKRQGRLVKKNAGASLIDLGDGIACFEFHSKHNALGQDILDMLHYSLEEVGKNYDGLVIGNQGRNFSVGANLMLLLMEAQNENWDEIERITNQFQQIAMKMKYFEKPIVAAPFGQTLGGGVELCLPTSHVQASGETYMGLVEAGVGLIPAGGGTKEMLWRSIEQVDMDRKVDLQPYVNRVFETIAMAKVSSSAVEAAELGYLRSTDRFSMNQDHQLYEAKQVALRLATAGYSPPKPKKIRVVGEPGLAVMQLGIHQLKAGGYVTDHDVVIARKLAEILSGGKIAANTEVTENYLLELEREAFLSLCGEPKSQARMQHMLLKNRPLRN